MPACTNAVVTAGLFVILVVLGGRCAAQDEPARPGLTCGPDAQVYKDGAPYQGFGINYFNAFADALLGDTRALGYREAFQELAAHEIPFVRFMAGAFYPNEMRRYLDDPEGYFEVMDGLVRAAEETGLGLIPSLFWHDACLPDLVGEPRGKWGDPESKTIALMRRYTRDIVQRYLDSRALWAWEFGNEYSLGVDLPNASEHRPWILPDKGTPSSRSEADDLTREMILVAFREFARTVRELDDYRLITTGNSLPRPCAYHLHSERAWVQDTREEFVEDLLAVTPDPMDLISVHIYDGDHRSRFGQDLVPCQETIALCMAAGKRTGKPLFVGEYGCAEDELPDGPDGARRKNLGMLAAIEREGVPLSAHWTYNFPHQKDTHSVTSSNSRAYVLAALRLANRRTKLYRTGAHRAALDSSTLTGWILDNRANEGRSGSGFNPLYLKEYPGENLFLDSHVGLNFEHVFDGTAAHRDLARFTPRKDPCRVVAHSPSSVSIQWPAETSSWGMVCEMCYTLSEEHCIDLEFRTTPTREAFPLGYAAMMWASYMNHARDRLIHFYGTDGQEEGWVSFGEAPEGGDFETGTVACAGVPDLPFEEGADLLNLREHPTKKFTLPFYYGLIDGDGDPSTGEDTMVYIMMFDQRDPIRFAMWNFERDAAGRTDPRSPAWDWQFVIRDPKPGQTYGYRARVVCKPFSGAEDVHLEYLRWAESLETAAPR